MASPSEAVVAERLEAALNAHDVDALVDCFDEAYESEQPVHPQRVFSGREQVRANWSAIFAGVSDFRCERLRTAAGGDTEWSEWRWRGTRADAAPFDMAGVILCGVRDGRIRWARLYMEPVEPEGPRIDEAVGRVVGGG